jgi:hypothetical protein
VLAVGSSQKDQNSYSWGNDAYIGLSLVDRFTYVLLEQMDKVRQPRQAAGCRSFLPGPTYPAAPTLVSGVPAVLSEPARRRLGSGVSGG